MIGPPRGPARSGPVAFELALDTFDVGLVARDGGLELGHAVQVLLVVARLAADLVGLAVVVFLGQVGLARLRAAQLLLRMALASASRARCSAGSTRGADAGAVTTGLAVPAPAPDAGAGVGEVPRTTVTLPPSTSLQSLRPLIWLVYSLPQR